MTLDPGQPNEVINEFSGGHRWLSNFWMVGITHDGILYPSVEHAYQAAKTLDFAQRWEISQLAKPGEAKRAGRKVAIRPDWEQIKDRIMGELLVQKFSTYPELRHKLLATGHCQLIEGNLWHDQVWGSCNCATHAGIPGENRLGKVLMQVRSLLQA